MCFGDCLFLLFLLFKLLQDTVPSLALSTRKALPFCRASTASRHQDSAFLHSCSDAVPLPPPVTLPEEQGLGRRASGTARKG